MIVNITNQIKEPAMKLRNIFFYLLGILSLAICPAYAVELTVAPLGDGRYSVNGAAMDGVAGIDLTVTYDSSLLSGPSIIQGGVISGAMMASNTNNSGTIKVAIISTRAFSGNGQIIAINFAGRNGSGGITTINAKTIDIKGAQLQTTAFVIQEQPSGSSSQPPDSSGFPQDRQAATQYQTPAGSTSPTTSTSVTPSIGSISLPADNMQPDTQKRQEQQISPPPAEQYRQTPQTVPRAEENRQTEVKPKKTEELKRSGYVSVLDRFKAYKGDRNPLILAELFSKAIDSAITQEPMVSGADGTATIKLKVLLDLKEDDSAPNFAASEAKIVSLKSDEATGRWVIDLLPSKGVVTASLSILAGNRLMDIPLVTVPLAKSLSFSDKEIAAFIKDFGAEKPLYDLNKDGRHDYIDDYIYAGNLRLTGKKPGAAK